MTMRQMAKHRKTELLNAEQLKTQRRPGTNRT